MYFMVVAIYILLVCDEKKKGFIRDYLGLVIPPVNQALTLN